MKFRSDIQILRGIAVTLVLLFHLSAPGFDSGFLGVDVFFVISGYLMARLYNPADKLAFFRKRSLRILPAYFVLVLLTLAASAFITVPSEYDQVQVQSVFAAFFASNIGFWAENSYFDKAAFKPLLHLWSLGVEIQFYLLVPLISWIARRQPMVFGVLFAGSIISCFAMLGMSPKTSFFWLPFRLWEFLIGFGIATLGYTERANGRLPWIGFACLLAVIFISFFRVNVDALETIHGHPGLISFLITAATGATIAFGLPLQVENNIAARIFRKIGDYSYSIYLVHFAIIVLFLYRPFAGTIIEPASAKQAMAIMALIAIASILFHRLIEGPGRKLGSHALLGSYASILVLVVVTANFVPFIQAAITPRDQLLIYRAWSDRGEYRCGKLNRIFRPAGKSCEITAPIDEPAHRILFVGNSHADSIKAAFAASAQIKNVSLYFIVENTPLMPQGYMTPERILDEALYRKVDAIVLHYSPGSISLETVAQLSRLAKENAIRLDFIMPVPTWGGHVPTLLLHHVTEGSPLPLQTIEDYRRSNYELSEALSKISGLTVYRVENIFCDPNCRFISNDGRPLYFDRDHLTLTGGALLKGRFDQIIQDLH